jgi:hypothetical protein
VCLVSRGKGSAAGHCFLLPSHRVAYSCARGCYVRGEDGGRGFGASSAR